MTCARCNAKIAPGELHSCGGPSLHAPWLQEAMEAQRDELRKMRALIEIALMPSPKPGNPEAKGRAAKRETR